MAREGQFDNFNKFAESYHEICDEAISKSGADSNYFCEYKILELLKFENPNQTLKILDFGCGDGNSSFFFRKHFRNASIFGIDVSEKSINIAKNKNITNTTFDLFGGTIMPYKDEEFDLVFTSMVFHHIEFNLHDTILKEISRVLKKGGRFYNFEHNPINPLIRKVVQDCEYDKDAVLLKPSYNKAVTFDSGLRVENLNFTLFFPRYKFFKIFLGLEKMLTWCPIGAQYYIRAVKKVLLKK